MYLKSAGGLFMSTVVIFREIVFSSASRYRSMKYSWSKRFKGTGPWSTPGAKGLKVQAHEVLLEQKVYRYRSMKYSWSKKIEGTVPWSTPGAKSLKVLSSEMDPAKIRSFERERGAEEF
jgi:hypothetical protein